MAALILRGFPAASPSLQESWQYNNNKSRKCPGTRLYMQHETDLRIRFCERKYRALEV